MRVPSFTALQSDNDAGRFSERIGLMGALVDHIEAFKGLYIVAVAVLAVGGGIWWFDVSSARRSRGKDTRQTGPDHTRTVHTHDPWAGMDESGPEI
jgi:hypothetical protein